MFLYIHTYIHTYMHACMHAYMHTCIHAYHTIPYHTIPYHTIPYHTIPYHTIPYHTIPYHTIPYHTIPYHTIPYHTIPYHTIPYIHTYIYIYIHIVYIHTYTHTHSIYTYIYIYIWIYEPGPRIATPPLPPVVWSPRLHCPKPLPFARYLQHLGGTASHLYAICSVWEPQPRHWTLSSCICLRCQSSTYYPKPVCVLPIAYLTRGFPLTVCLYTTYMLPIDYILIEYLCIPI